ncbi:50S ribosomal protein L19 [Candidatus Roizmanbacteria bacterium]|nr:50S ribosomal protein L19 [Candidatus Roizmanbacteria bacterium]
MRKIAKTGIGIERIVPLVSPFLSDIALNKKTDYHKSKLYFVRSLSGQETKTKLK